MKADLHIHTLYSYDGSSSPQEIVNAAIERHIHCLCITDHGEIKGAIEAIRFSLDKNILIIPGIEVKSKEGDILGINIKKKIRNGLSAKETIEEIRKQGAIAVIAHPFAFPQSYKGFTGNMTELFKENPGYLLDGIEVLNASVFGSANQKAFELAQKFSLPFTAGSDAHNVAFVGKSYIETKKENLSTKELINEIKSRNVYLGGEGASFLEKVKDHAKRNIAKLTSHQ